MQGALGGGGLFRSSLNPVWVRDPWICKVCRCQNPALFTTLWQRILPQNSGNKLIFHYNVHGEVIHQECVLVCLYLARMTIVVYENGPFQIIPASVATSGNKDTSITTLLPDIAGFRTVAALQKLSLFLIFIYFMKMSFSFMTLFLPERVQICPPPVSLLFSVLFLWHQAERRALINPSAPCQLPSSLCR